MSTFTLLAGCLALGIVVNLVRPVPQRVIHGLNAWILRVALPALALTALPRLEFTRDLLNLVPAELANAYCVIPIYMRSLRREGDTLYSLSRRFNVPVKDIAAANRLRNERIAIGQRLVIPTRYR